MTVKAVGVAGIWLFIFSSTYRGGRKGKKEKRRGEERKEEVKKERKAEMMRETKGEWVSGRKEKERSIRTGTRI